MALFYHVTIVVKGLNCFVSVIFLEAEKLLTYFPSHTCRMCSHSGMIICYSPCCVLKCYLEDVM